MYRNFAYVCLLACFIYEMGFLVGRAPYQNLEAVIVPKGYVAVVRHDAPPIPPGWLPATKENVDRVLRSLGEK